MSKQEDIGLGIADNSKYFNNEEGPFLKVTAGKLYTGQYDVDTNNMIFWRGDTRTPVEVFKTGFSSRYVRELNRREIVWRCGIDDIVSESAVCMARDIRGAAFFPYPPNDSDTVNDDNYIYAMSIPRAACTYQIQQVAETSETNGRENWRNNTRFTYDPTWENYSDASCVWQFGEYAVHDVPGTCILAGWPFKRHFLVGCKDEERGQAGIKFMLGKVEKNPANKNLKDLAESLRIAKNYNYTYPRNSNLYLSYFGIVDAGSRIFTTKESLKNSVKQVKAILTNSDDDWSVRNNVLVNNCNI